MSNHQSPVVILCLLPALNSASTVRAVISLDGNWDIAEGTMEQAPARFERRVPVPGLVDMAQPAFAGVGETNRLREAFWYRKTFQIKEAVPAVALLKIHKAACGARVWLNGTLVNEHLPSFTPGYFEVRNALRGAGATNELRVRVGASAIPCPRGQTEGHPPLRHKP